VLLLGGLAFGDFDGNDLPPRRQGDHRAEHDRYCGGSSGGTGTGAPPREGPG
jgi:hypothetical protein